MQAFRNQAFLKQLAVECLCLAFVVCAAGLLSGPAAAGWAAVSAGVGAAFFIAVSQRRYREMAALACEVDEVLRQGRAIDLSDYREGDLAILKNQLVKLVASLCDKTARLGQEKLELARALADVSHQIRTPLTAMGLMLAVAQQARDEDARRRALHELERMVDRVGWLVSALLKLAKADAGAMAVQSVSVDAAEVARKAVEPLEASFDLRGVTCEVVCEGEASYVGDPAWSAEALGNVVKNCLEHTPAGGRVTVEVRRDALACRIRVTDTGPGISNEDLPHVFERFYRGKADAGMQEGPASQGFGIGLALAQSLTAAQGGTLRASNAPGAGARFDFTFPSVVV